MPKATLAARFLSYKRSVKIAAETVPVAVVVVGHNYGAYLGDCLDSVLAQNPAPAEIIYCDNGSTDGSLSLAKRRGVRVVRAKGPTICTARNTGATLTRSPFLIFLDADDCIPQGYVKTLYDASAEGRDAIVYPSIQKFGPIKEAATPGADWGRRELLRSNFIQTSALVRRTAFEQVHGFDEGLPCFQDWDLWLRITANRWHVKHVPGTAIHHRSHRDSLTANSVTRLPWYQDILSRQPTTAFIPFGPGRPIIGFDRFREMLDAYGLNWEQTNLLFYDNTGDAETGRTLRAYLSDCPARHTGYIRDDHRVSYHDPQTRVAVMPQRMCEMWSRASEMFMGDFIMSIEDDTEPEQPGAFRALFDGMAPDVDAVTGAYNSRPLVDSNVPLVRDWITRKDGTLSTAVTRQFPGGLPVAPRVGCQDIGASGVGCMLLRREAIENYDYEVGRPGAWLGQDFGLCRHIKERGRRLLVNWAVRCKHWHTKEQYT